MQTWMAWLVWFGIPVVYELLTTLRVPTSTSDGEMLAVTISAMKLEVMPMIAIMDAA